MKKLWIWIVVVIVIVVGAIAIFHKSSKSTTSTSTGSNSTPAVNNAVVLTKTSSSLGQYLTDPNGRALYTYNADTSGVSNCTGSCLARWPAYTAKSSSNLPTGVSTIKRTDNGQTQYTYNGMPLYYFVSDSGTQVTGNGVENFTVAKPSSSSSSNSSSSNSSNSSSSSSSNSSGYSY